MNLERLELFKELCPYFKIDKIVRLTKSIRYDDLNIHEGIYLVSTPRLSTFSGNMVVVIVDLDNTMSGHMKDISINANCKGFSCWRIKLVDFEEMKEFEPLIASSNFLWKGEDNDD